MHENSGYEGSWIVDEEHIFDGEYYTWLRRDGFVKTNVVIIIKFHMLGEEYREKPRKKITLFRINV